MNRIYRLVWSQGQQAFVAVAEFAAARGKSSGKSGARVGTLLAGVLLASGASAAGAAGIAADTLPAGYQLTAGSAAVSSAGNAMTVQQASQRAAINWQSFSIGSNATVNFQQPNASAVVLNRVVGNEQSVISGALNANGQVFLLNSNGVLFTQGAQVNTGGLVASTLGLSDADFMAGRTSFSANGSKAGVINLGTINAAEGGYAALLGNQVSNQGVIAAHMGSAVLAAGDQISLNFNGNSLVGVTVNKAALNALVENKQAIYADGGLVILTAAAVDNLLANVVNNTGEIRARTVASQSGRIYLLGEGGSVRVDGSLDASAPDGGDGGFIETSAGKVRVADGAHITTAAATGQAGTWLIDPVDFTIAPDQAGTVSAGSPSGDISGATLSAALAGGNVTILSSQGSSAAGAGNINVNDAVSWSANKLTLTAANNVNINAVVAASGNASLAMNPATANGGDAAVNTGTVHVALGSEGFTGRVDFSGSGTLSIGGINYTVINSLGAASSSTGSDLQGMNGNLSGHYALGSNINASATSGWGDGAGFVPVGSAATPFGGVLDGLGHTISGLVINRLGSDQVGLFGYGSASSVVRNVGLTGASVFGKNFVGALMGSNLGSIADSYVDATLLANQAAISYLGGMVGLNQGKISNSHAGGSVTAAASYDTRVGGLVGGNLAEGSISDSYTTASVTILNNGVATPDAPTLGGLAGINDGIIANSYATGLVTNGNGGLVGLNNGAISGSHATGSVINGGDSVGGLVGVNYGPISNSYTETGSVIGGRNNIGGLVGYNTADITGSHSSELVGGVSAVGGLVGANAGGNISDSHADGASVIASSWFGTSDAGGLVGYNHGNIDASYASATVRGDASNVGGLIGHSDYGAISDSHAAGAVSGGANTGGLVGMNAGNVTNSYASAPTVAGGGNVGGLIGYNTGNIDSAYASGAISGNSAVGGLVGVNIGGTISGSHVETGSVTAGNWWGESDAGGLVGYSSGSIDTSYASVSVTATGNDVGGLVGHSDGATIVASNASGAVSGGSNVGGLAGFNRSAVTDSYSVSETITGAGGNVGGLIGNNTGAIGNGYAIGVVTGGGGGVGGLVGYNTANIDASHASGAVSGNSAVGGLVGVNIGGRISDSHADGASVTAGNWWGGSDAGGLVGYNTGNIANTYAIASVTGTGSSVGGLVGTSDAGTISASHATGSVSGISNVGGLVGLSRVAISGSDAIGNVTGAGDNIGGLVGDNENGSISASHSTGAVTGHTAVGGLAGVNRGSITDSYAGTGAITAGEFWGGSSAGGLVGWNGGSIDNSRAGGAVTAAGSGVGGLVGTMASGSISDSHATGAVSGINDVGGLAGYNNTSISGSDASGAVTGVGSNIGGLVGNNDGGGSIVGGHATGDVTGFTTVGGLVGVNRGSIHDSQADTGTVSAGNFWGGSTTGGLVGYNNGVIANSSAGGAVTATGSGVGGLVGTSDAGGSIDASHATGTVSGTNDVGGLVGYNRAGISGSDASGAVTGSGGNVGGLLGNNSGGTVSGSHASGTVAGVATVGGLVGYNDHGVVGDSYSTGDVSGGNDVGGLVGVNAGSISGSHASGAATGWATDNWMHTGGLVGNNVSGASIGTSYATGEVIGHVAVGGLVGSNSGSITDSEADTGSVSAGNWWGLANAGGLVGENVNGGSIANSHAAGTVSGSGSNVGGLVGYNASSVVLAGNYATGAVSGGSNVGGLVGSSASAISGGSASGDVSGGSNVGGLVGSNSSAITGGSASGDVSGDTNVGGLVGSNSGSISGSNASGKVDGNTNVGGLAGNSGSGSSINAGHATGDVVGVIATGGLVGSNSGSIVDSDASGAVTANGDGATNVGGLVGENINSGSIANSHADGTVSSSGSYVGGLVGNNSGIAQITGSHATGDVSGDSYVGGLVGGNGQSVTGSYATGTVSGTSYVGGLAGINYGTLADDYATGAVNGTSFVGGLVGENNGILSNAFYNVDQVSINGGKLLTAGGIYDAQYQDWMDHGKSLDIAGYSASLAFDGASGSYTVGSVAGLRAMLGFSESNNAGLKFSLGNSIDLAQASELWVPYFAPSFDGAGKVIANARIEAQSINSQVGFFGRLLGSVSNLGLPGVVVAGNSMTGGLAGNNLGSISNSYVDGQVSGSLFTGGLVGYNTGSVANSYATGEVSGDTYTGGLAGINLGSLGNTYAAAKVSGNTYTGGLAGINAGTVTASFWDNQASGASTGANINPAGVVGMNTADIQQKANYTGATEANGNADPGWDFSNTWVMYDGHSSPLLRVFMTPLTVTANSVAKTYDGKVYDGSAGVSYSDTPDMSKLLGTVSYDGTRNAGTYAITPSGLYSNQQGYILSYASGTLQVNPAVLAVTATGAGKVYDGTTATTASLSANAIEGDGVSLAYAAANFADANAGSGKRIDVTGLSISGADAANYTLQGTSTTATADILQRQLNVVARDGASKVYDGTRQASASLLRVTGLLGEDGTELTGNGLMSGKDVGSHEFSLGSLALSNANYTLVGGRTSGTVAVTARPVAVAPIDGASRAYDGTADAVASLLSVTNAVGGDTVALSGKATLSGSGAGDQPLMSLAGLSLGNANYTLVGGSASGTVAVTKAALTYALSLRDPSQTFTASGLDLYTAGTVGSVLNAALQGVPEGGSTPASLAYSLWKDGAEVRAVNGAGAYEVRAAFAPSDPNYSIGAVGNTVLRFVVNNPRAMNSVVATAIQPTQQTGAPQPALPGGQGGGVDTASRQPGNGPGNVVNALPQIAAAFGQGSSLSLVSSPSANEPTQAVTLSQARAMLQSGLSMGGDAGISPDVRVPVSRNSLAEIVNGGVKLPNGVEQELFVVSQ